MSNRAAIAVVVILVTAACNSQQPTDVPTSPEGSSMELSSPAFDDGEAIPTRHTCDGDDLSPALQIEGVPADAASLLLVMDDPDAPGGTFDHWVLFGIPPGTTTLAEGEQQVGTPGRNSFGNLGYGGPCPPPGEEHRYVFTLRALSEPLDVDSGVTKAEAVSAAEGTVLAEATLTGRYER